MTDLPPARPVFVPRPTYRRRRLMDAARLLPIAGAGLLAVPLMWPRGGDAQGAGGVAMSDAMLYVFGVWGLLILLAAYFGLRTQDWDPEETVPKSEARGTDAP